MTIINTREATQGVLAAKLTRLTHRTEIQLRVVAVSCTISSSRFSPEPFGYTFVFVWTVRGRARKASGNENSMTLAGIRTSYFQSDNRTRHFCNLPLAKMADKRDHAPA